VNAEFQWWLLIVGIVIGGALVYLVLADLQGDAADADEPLGDVPLGDEPTDEPWDDEAVADGPTRSVGRDHPDVEGDRSEGHPTETDLG
jgi:hypothetical protein